MMRSRMKRISGASLGCSVALALAVGGSAMQSEGQGDAKESKAALPAEQVIALIGTAIIAQPGSVRALEAENEGGKIICEVEILAPDGKTYEVEMDVATNTVIEIEVDDDNDDEEDEDEDKN